MRSIAAPSLAALTALLVLAACGTGVSPAHRLTGTWQTPSLSADGGIQLRLKSGLSSITGTGQTIDSAQSVTASYTIQGTYQGSSVYLSMSYQGGGTGSFTGTLVGDTAMQGTWAPPAPAAASTISLMKQ